MIAAVEPGHDGTHDPASGVEQHWHSSGSFFPLAELKLVYLVAGVLPEQSGQIPAALVEKVDSQDLERVAQPNTYDSPLKGTPIASADRC